MRLLPEALPVTCTSCGVQISWRYADMEFSCPACGCGLRLRYRYFRVLYLTSYALAVAIAYAVGFRDDALGAAGVLALLPVYFIVTALNMRLFPPEVEVSGAFRSILHPGEPEDPSRPADPVIFGSTSPASIEVRRPKSSLALLLRPEPQTTEGWVIYVALVALNCVQRVSGRPTMWRARRSPLSAMTPRDSHITGVFD